MTSIKLRKVRVVTVEAKATDPAAPAVENPADVAGIARLLLPTDREGLAVFHLDARHRIRSVELAAVGSLNACVIHPREVFKAAILANAAAILMVHNHPSGAAIPSDEDVAITNRIGDAGRMLGIELLDHVIVTETDFHSIRGKGGKKT